MNSKEDPFRIIVHKNDIYSKRSIAYMSREALTNWNISIFRKAGTEDNVNNIYGGDLVRFLNPELKGFLYADHIYEGNKPHIFYRCYKGNEKEENYGCKDLWQIENIRESEFGEVIRSYENMEDSINLKLRTKQLRIRHFVTGRLLKMIPGTNSKHYETILEQDWVRESNIVEMKSTTKMTLELIMFDHKFLKHRSLFFIFSNNMYMRYHQRKKLTKPIA